MKIKMDNNADALYIYIQNKNNKVESTIMADEFFDLKGMVNFDIDLFGNIVGIEIIPIKLIGEINNLQFKIIDKKGLKVIFSKDNLFKKLDLYKNNISIFLDKDGKIQSIEIFNIFDINNFLESIIISYE